MFIYKHWEKFCIKLNEHGYHSITANHALNLDKQTNKAFLILKHDVETNPAKALKLARIESKYQHHGSYYVQAYLLKKKRNIDILKKIQSLGHEVSYHYNVMDLCKGCLLVAEELFKKELQMFENNGFYIVTVCQHGDPLVERKGYFSNRDFFRNTAISNKYCNIFDIMTNFRANCPFDYKYISDAGHGWKIIYNPETNDISNTEDKNIPLDSIEDIISILNAGESCIISTHPHRWHANAFASYIHSTTFKVIKCIALRLLKIKAIKKFINRFNCLFRKI